jgi:hypothetical protein
MGLIERRRSCKGAARSGIAQRAREGAFRQMGAPAALRGRLEHIPIGGNREAL